MFGKVIFQGFKNDNNNHIDVITDQRLLMIVKKTEKQNKFMILLLLYRQIKKTSQKEQKLLFDLSILINEKYSDLSAVTKHDFYYKNLHQYREARKELNQLSSKNLEAIIKKSRTSNS